MNEEFFSLRQSIVAFVVIAACFLLAAHLEYLQTL